MKITLSGEPIDYGVSEDEILMGFDRMTDSEIIYTMENTPYPEFMGGKLKQWLQRRKKRAKAFGQKLKKKFKKLPKWAKIATGIFAAPLALAAGPGAAIAAGKALKKKRQKKLAAMTPEQRAAFKKKRKRRGIAAASMLVPGAGIAAAIRRRRKKRLAKKRARRTVTQVVRPTRATAGITARRMPPGLAKMPVKKVPIPPAAVAQAEASDEAGAVAVPEKKKGGLGGLLGLGALAALPFLLGS